MRILSFLPILLLSALLASCTHEGKYLAPVKEEGKYGYINENGDMVIDAKFEDAWSFIRGSAIVKENGKYGMIDKKGEYLVNAEYDSIIPFSAECVIAEKNSLFSFIENGTGKIILPPQFERVFYYTQELCIVQKGKGLGIVNDQGKIVCPLIMQDFKDMMGPAARCIQHDTTDEVAMLMALIQGGQGAKIGLLNRKGEVIVQPKYDEIFDKQEEGFFYPFLRAKDAPIDTTPAIDGVPPSIPPGTYGIIDTTGKIICEPVFEDIPVYGNGLFRVMKNGKYGYADMKGNLVIQPQYDFATEFSEDKAIVSIGKTASIIDKTDNKLVADLGPGSGMYKFSCGRARCRNVSDGMYGFMDATGNRLIPPAFDVADDFKNDRAIVSVNNKYGLIDKNGHFIVEPQYEFFYDLDHGYYQTRNADGKVGVLDSTGKTILAEAFDEVFHFQKNFLEVDLDGLSGCYSITGKEIFRTASTRPVYFYNGRCVVNENGLSGMIDTSGRLLLPLEYDSIGVFFKGYATILKAGKYGAIDSTGAIVIPTKFEEVRPIVNGFAVYSEKGKYGYLNSKGEVMIEAKYQDASVLVDPDRREFE